MDNDNRFEKEITDITILNMNGLRVLVIPKGYKRKLSQVVHSYSFDAVILEEYLRTGDEEYEIEQHMS